MDAGRKLEKIDIRELSIWLRNPNRRDRLTLRINDATNQTRSDFAENREERRMAEHRLAARTIFHSPRTSRCGDQHRQIRISVGRSQGRYLAWPCNGDLLDWLETERGKTRAIWLNDVTIAPRPLEVPGAGTAVNVALDEVLDGNHDWRFTKGEEFKGANGSLSVIKDEPTKGETSFELAGDFTGGGARVAAIKDLPR